VAIARHWRGKHVSATMNEHAATVEELHDPHSRETMRYGNLEPRMTVLARASSNFPDPTSQSVRGWGLRLSVLSCIVNSRYLAPASEQTEDFICSVALVM
jgi:hypothetical protein